MELEKAKVIADEKLKILEPYCVKIAIAGSVRREKQFVKDIEIVCIPRLEFIMKPKQESLFGVLSNVPDQETVRNREFCKIVNQWKPIKGKATGKYTQRVLPEGINLDLFMVQPNSWGLQLAIRTGSAEYSHKVLGKRWVSLGYRLKDAILYRGKKTFEIREEKEFFKLLGLPYPEPREREYFEPVKR